MDRETHINMARSNARPVSMLVLAALLVAVPGLLASIGAASSPPALPAPLALDSFLATVARHTPASPRTVLLVAGDPPALVFYRATYRLYPRTVRTAFAVDYRHATSTPAATWPALRGLARSVGAGYVLLWGIPVVPPGRPLVVDAALPAHSTLTRVMP